MNREKILLLSHSPHLCGAERMLLNLAIGLKTHTCFEPILLIPDPESGPLRKLADDRSVTWFNIPSPSWFVGPAIIDTKFVIGKSLSNSIVLESLFGRLCPVAVISNTLTSLDGLLACAKLKLPSILWIHGILDAGMVGHYDYSTRFCENLALNLANRIVCCSDWTRKHFVHRVPTEHKLTTIHNWTDGPFNRKDLAPSKRLSILSTLEFNKGIMTAIDAINLLRDKGYRLDIYGDGSDAVSFRHRVEELQITEQVRFNQRTTNVNAVYDSTDITLFPSYMESFGMVAIESMARGTPVIASRVGGLQEIISDGKTGVLFEAGNAADLAHKIETLMNDNQLLESISANAYESAGQNFDGTASIQAFNQLIDSIKSTESHDAFNAERLEFLHLVAGTMCSSDVENFNYFARSHSETVHETSSGNSQYSFTPNYLEGNFGTHIRGVSLPYIEAFDSFFEGMHNGAFLRGWVRSENDADACHIDVFADGVFCGRCVANLPRADLRDAGFENCDRGFFFPVPSRFRDSQMHKFEVTIAGDTRQLVGSPANLITQGRQSNFEELLGGVKLRGWVEPVENENSCLLDLMVDDIWICSFECEISRSDVRNAGHLNGRGFECNLPLRLLDGLEHSFKIKFCDNGAPINNVPAQLTTANISSLSFSEMVDKFGYSHEEIFDQMLALIVR